jgi:hypothetical protein
VWVEIPRPLVGFQPVAVEYDYQRIIQEELLSQVLSPASVGMAGHDDR